MRAWGHASVGAYVGACVGAFVRVCGARGVCWEPGRQIHFWREHTAASLRVGGDFGTPARMMAAAAAALAAEHAARQWNAAAPAIQADCMRSSCGV